MDEEEAKAVQEVAKTTRKALEVTEKIGKFLREIIGDGFTELGGTFYDWTKYIREKNLLKIYDKLEAIYVERKIKGKAIPLASRYAIPIIQNASLEDDDSIQSLWAGLIANSTDPNNSINPKKIYIDILSSLEPLDAKVLQFFPSEGWNMFPGGHSDGFSAKKLSEDLAEEINNIELSLQNLARLGCIMDSFNQKTDKPFSTSFGSTLHEESTTFRPTPLGFELLIACNISKLEGNNN